MLQQGRTIRIFLVDGSPNGLLTAEIMNWTGHALSAPRSRLAELIKRQECGRTGIYFLIGQNQNNISQPAVYIGESDDVAKRLKQHNQPEEKGGKDFWERVCLFTSKDHNLTKAHVKFLESQLIELASNSGRCTLTNSTSHQYLMLPEADVADMNFFIEQIRTILPVLGLDFLRDGTNKIQSAEYAKKSPKFNLSIPKYNILATAEEIDGDFIVLEGSTTRHKWAGTKGGYQGLFEQLVTDKILVEHGESLYRFSRDYLFSSPSAAAAIVSGRSANGRTSWLVCNSGQTYGGWQMQQIECATM